MYFGVDYFLEHWSRERWHQDARMMKDLGVRIVRVGEFTWGRSEPQEGVYDFSWLDEAVDTFARQSIKVVLCTPTACPPIWLVEKYPDILPIDEEGRMRGFGSRRHYCVNNPIYQHYTEQIVSKITGHFKDNPAVIGWQIDNELGCSNTARCYCNYCSKALREWLKNKHGTIENLNKEWGTNHWSQMYHKWEQIRTPGRTVTTHNPSFLLDFFRFASDSNVKYEKLQADIIRSNCPQHFITHNFMGLFDQIDYFDLAEPLDFASWDNYPRYLDLDPKQVALAHDITRSTKHKNFWVMEEQAGSCGGKYVNSQPRPGEVRLWAYQAIARGADGIMFLQWRPPLFAQEQFWMGILDHDGNPNRKYEEVKRFGAELMALEEISGSKFKAEVGMIRSYDVIWSLQIQPNSPAFNYHQEFMKYYSSLFNLGVSTEIVNHKEELLSNYKLIMAPNLHLVNRELTENLRHYVKRGGRLIMSYRSGVKNWNNVVVDKTLPGGLADLLGIKITEFDPLPPNRTNTLKVIHPDLEGLEGKATVWCDIIDLVTARNIANYAEDYYAGKAAITINRYGDGEAIYVGTSLDSKLQGILMKWILRKAGVKHHMETPSDVELTKRVGKNQEYLFLLNHSSESKNLKIGLGYENILTSQKLSNSIVLKAKDVLILVKSNS